MGLTATRARVPSATAARVGECVEKDGRLVRPAQDRTGGYGPRAIPNRILRLDRDEYGEAPIRAIEPAGPPGVLRTDTYAVDDGIEALDGPRYAWRGSVLGWRAGPRRPAAPERATERR